MMASQEAARVAERTKRTRTSDTLTSRQRRRIVDVARCPDAMRSVVSKREQSRTGCCRRRAAVFCVWLPVQQPMHEAMSNTQLAGFRV